MRYAPEPNLAFIHIPKNGGQSVRNALAEATQLSFAALAADLGVTEEEAATAMEADFDHPRSGRIKPSHMPLRLISEEFPASWSLFTGAHSFALTRAPRDRFISALMQRLKEFRNAGAIRADDPIVADEARTVCDWLAARPYHTDIDYIHFAQQVHFTDLNGKRVVSAVFPLSDTTALSHWIAAKTGLSVTVGHDHARRQPKPWARAIQPVARFSGRWLMPKAVKRALHPLWTKSGVFADAAKGYASVSLGEDVERFIKDYYAADAALHAEAKAHAAQWTTAPAATA